MANSFRLFDPTMETLAAAMRETVRDHERTTHRIANLTNPSFHEILTDEEKKIEGRREGLLEEAVRDLQKYSGRYEGLAQLMRSKEGMLRTIITQGRQ